jgi:alpha-tubulin suppressor-like RCC1 family protein
VSAGTLYTCFFLAILPSSCAGTNSVGQLGNGTTISSSVPVAISVQQHLSFISAGLDHACGVADSANAYCWGNNNAGQLGDGTNTNSATPIVVAGGLNWAMVVAGGHHTCGVTVNNLPSPIDSAVYCWGDNTYGQLGNYWTASSSVPVNVTAPRF